ncbi:hypothetical protein CASFOL_026238 [Castilleja foliolosa]|uniref:Uncharacterized protein n=1 Tax=Castilleja foliolosa TaxID=1961234 RepID=A0ABD3CKS3_9LAMI
MARKSGCNFIHVHHFPPFPKIDRIPLRFAQITKLHYFLPNQTTKLSTTQQILMGKKKATRTSDEKLSNAASGNKPQTRQNDGGDVIKVSESQLNPGNTTDAASRQLVLRSASNLNRQNVEVQQDEETETDEEEEDIGSNDEGVRHPTLE